MTGKKLTKFFYYLRNVTERTILTGTFSPSNFPASQRGILLRIPIASLLRLLSIEISRKRGGEKYVKRFDGYTHLLTILYAVI